MINNVEDKITKSEALAIIEEMGLNESIKLSNEMSYIDFIKEVLLQDRSNKSANYFIENNIFSKRNALEELKLLTFILSDTVIDNDNIRNVVNSLNKKLAFCKDEHKNSLQEWCKETGLTFEKSFKKLENIFFKDWSVNLESLRLFVFLCGGEQNIPENFSKNIVKNLIKSKSILKESFFSALLSTICVYPSFAIRLNDVYDLTEEKNYKKIIGINFRKLNQTILNESKNHPNEWKNVYDEIKDIDKLAKCFTVESYYMDYHSFHYNLEDFLLVSGSKARFNEVGKFRAFVIKTLSGENNLTFMFHNIEISQSKFDDIGGLSVFIGKEGEYNKEQLEEVLNYAITLICEKMVEEKTLNILIDEYLMNKLTENLKNTKSKIKKF